MVYYNFFFKAKKYYVKNFIKNKLHFLYSLYFFSWTNIFINFLQKRGKKFKYHNFILKYILINWKLIYKNSFNEQLIKERKNYFYNFQYCLFFYFNLLKPIFFFNFITKIKKKRLYTKHSPPHLTIINNNLKWLYFIFFWFHLKKYNFSYYFKIFLNSIFLNYKSSNIYLLKLFYYTYFLNI